MLSVMMMRLAEIDPNVRPIGGIDVPDAQLANFLKIEVRLARSG